MKVLRRLYRYLRNYKAWATLAFGSMIIFSVTTTAMIGLLQPIFDIGFTPPKPTTSKTSSAAAVPASPPMPR